MVRPVGISVLDSSVGKVFSFEMGTGIAYIHKVDVGYCLPLLKREYW